jgi:hypothetical protein
MGRAPINIERGGLYRIAASMPNKIIGVRFQLFSNIKKFELIGDASKTIAVIALLISSRAQFSYAK